MISDLKEEFYNIKIKIAAEGRLGEI